HIQILLAFRGLDFSAMGNSDHDVMDTAAPGSTTTVNGTAATTPANPFNLVNSEFVQVREDDEYLYIDIGRSEGVRQIYSNLYEQAENLEKRFTATLQSFLTQLQNDEM